MRDGDLYAQIGQIIKTKRLENHLTQDDLGRLVSLSRVSITNIEAGTQRPQPHTLQAIAKALGVSVADIWPDSGDPELGSGEASP